MRTVFLYCFVAAIPLFSREQPIQKPAFEAVSVKPGGPGGSYRGGGTEGDRYIQSGATLKLLLQIAYGTPARPGSWGMLLRANQIIGGPDWIDSDWFDIEAKVGCSGGVVSDEQLHLMVQSMLEDRFQLKVHHEIRKLPIYNLVVAKDKPKIKLSSDQAAARPSELMSLSPCEQPPVNRPAAINSRALPPGILLMRTSAATVTLTGNAVSIADLVSMLQQTDRMVVDKTNLNGRFDVTLQFRRDAPLSTVTPDMNASAPSLFTAIEEQLGLRLESAIAPLPVVVVDSAQRPSAN